tara:strand:- start:1738 stop:2160 length:423 start_codon:yes stop_codon:yes gene_type:complete
MYCGFPYIQLFDHENGMIVCSNCGTVVEQDFLMLTQNCPWEPLYDHDNQSFDFDIDNDIYIYLNIYCTIELYMSRKETALVRKYYTHLVDHHPHHIFLHHQQHIVKAIVYVLYPHTPKPSPSIEKIANKLKEHGCFIIDE